ncbi:MAG: proline--tRNA ligase, partial [Candidatus Marinimicrobia bacterium]|nr:proline--tRNA ligase [Candidatus Neomarinimicrobiota bacterium]
ENNTQEYVYASSWGVSTRLIGALIMTHGDDKGLILPPRLAPYQIVIVPIYRSDEDKSSVMNYVDSLNKELKDKGVRTHVDMRESMSPGFKFNDWEMKGVPLRVEVGPRDVEKGGLVYVNRLTGKKNFPTKAEFLGEVSNLLEDIQKQMFANRLTFREENTVDVNNYDELKEAVENGKFARTFWEGSSEDEERIQNETKSTIRNKLFEKSAESGKCVLSGKDSTTQVIFAKSY